jgi:hypothetical protein
MERIHNIEVFWRGAGALFSQSAPPPSAALAWNPTRRQIAQRCPPPVVSHGLD